MAMLEGLHTSRGLIPDAPILYLIRDGKLEGKYLVKTWISFLGDIFHPVSLQLKMGQQHLR